MGQLSLGPDAREHASLQVHRAEMLDGPILAYVAYNEGVSQVLARLKHHECQCSWHEGPVDEPSEVRDTDEVR